MNIKLSCGSELLIADWPKETPPTVAQLIAAAGTTRPGVVATWCDEQARLQRSPGQKTPRALLRRLAAQHLYFDLDAARPHPHVPLGALGLAAGAALSALTEADRERAVAETAARLMRDCGLASLRGWSADERAAWQRMAPVLALLDVARWTRAQRTALVALIRAKGGHSERVFVERFIAHRRLNQALAGWSPGPRR